MIFGAPPAPRVAGRSKTWRCLAAQSTSHWKLAGGILFDVWGAPTADEL